jgi:diguanylate cyclase (GGDEF)-like protein
MIEPDRLRAFWSALVHGQELSDEDRDGRWITILSAVRDLLGASYACVGVRTPGRALRLTLAGDKLRRRSFDRFQGVASCGATHLILEDEIRPGSSFRPGADGCSGIRVAGYVYAPVPRRVGSDRSWLIVGRRKSDPRFDEAHLEYVEAAAQAVGILLDNVSTIVEYEHLAMTDALTLIPNYRFLRLTLDRELARASRHGECFTVVMVDVDNLKKYNAEHGHLAGSELLQRLAKLLESEIRATDVVAKYGGDEFLLILPRTDPEGGLVLSERIRRRIADSLHGRGGEHISCSLGVAGYPRDGHDFESLISAADHALFTAKEEGRNQVVASAPPAGSIRPSVSAGGLSRRRRRARKSAA